MEKAQFDIHFGLCAAAKTGCAQASTDRELVEERQRLRARDLSNFLA